jgi:hypothetical protein
VLADAIHPCRVQVKEERVFDAHIFTLPFRGLRLVETGAVLHDLHKRSLT